MSADSKITKKKTPKRQLTFRELIRESWGPYKQLLPYVKPYRGRLVTGILCGAASGGVSALLMFVVKHVSNLVWPHGEGAPAKGLAVFQHAHAHAAAAGHSLPISQVIWTCSLIPLAMILRGALAYLNAYCVTWVSMKLLNDIRNDLFSKVVSQSMSFFNVAQSGQLIQRVVNDPRQAQAALTTISCDVIVQPFTIIAAVAALMVIDWKFTIVSFVLFPVCLVPITVFGRRVRKIGADEESGSGDLMVVLAEAFNGIRVVKALAREDFEHRDFIKAGQRQFRNALRVRKAMEIVGPLIESISAVGVMMALVYCAVGGVDAGTFISLVMGMFFLYDPAKKLSKVHLMIQKALASTTRIFEIMNMKPAVQDTPDAGMLKSACGQIEFENVTFSYREGLPPAVQNISLQINPGKTYALVGASGAGKSTMLSLLLRFYDPQNGSILIDGQDLRSVTQKSLREQVAIVTQDTFLFHTTIMENIRYGRLNATDAAVYAAAEQAFAHDFILAQPNGYETSIGDKGCNLSGGQQQRIAIARALLRNAPILLLDEATSALDSESEQKIQLALERLSAGRTVIAIAHRLSTILKADKIVAMDKGRIVETGTHAELFEKNGHYRRLYDLQFNRPNEEFSLLS